MSTAAAKSAPAVSRRREEIAWAMYDWASSAWSTIQITLIVYYITEVILTGKQGTSAYGYGISVSMLLSAIASPVIGALADARANKRTWLMITTAMGAGGAALIGIIPPEFPWTIAGAFFVACLGFELSWGIYNGFLPEIADDESMNRVSAWGFGFGYIGGGIVLLLGILLLKFGERFGLPNSDANPTPHLRLCILITGAWWALFSLPTFIVLRDRGRPQEGQLALVERVTSAFRQVGKTLVNVRRYRMLALFLVGFLFYNDGMQTVITQASVFASKELHMKAGDLALVILAVQFVSLPGALLVGKLSDWIGVKRTLHLNLAIWVALLIAGFFVTTKLQFWIMAMVLALVMGGGQSVSRAIMGFMTPKKHAAEFMGFFNLSGRAASMLGPAVFTTALNWRGSAHFAILSLLIFFIIGWLLILPVDVERGREQAAKGV